MYGRATGNHSRCRKPYRSDCLHFRQIVNTQRANTQRLHCQSEELPKDDRVETSLPVVTAPELVMKLLPPVLLEILAAGQKILVVDVRCDGKQPGHVDGGATVEQQAIRIEQPNLAVGADGAVNDRCTGTSDAVERDAYGHIQCAVREQLYHYGTKTIRQGPIKSLTGKGTHRASCGKPSWPGLSLPQKRGWGGRV